MTGFTFGGASNGSTETTLLNVYQSGVGSIWADALGNLYRYNTDTTDYTLVKTVSGTPAATLADASTLSPAAAAAGAGVARAATLETGVAANGSVAAGAVSVTFANSGNNIAVVGGGNLGPGEAVTWTAPDGDTLAAIAYDVTTNGTTLVITKTA